MIRNHFILFKIGDKEYRTCLLTYEEAEQVKKAIKEECNPIINDTRTYKILPPYVGYSHRIGIAIPKE